MPAGGEEEPAGPAAAGGRQPRWGLTITTRHPAPSWLCTPGPLPDVSPRLQSFLSFQSWDPAHFDAEAAEEVAVYRGLVAACGEVAATHAALKVQPRAPAWRARVARGLERHTGKAGERQVERAVAVARVECEGAPPPPPPPPPACLPPKPRPALGDRV